jgi:hypothetical protein
MFLSVKVKSIFIASWNSRIWFINNKIFHSICESEKIIKSTFDVLEFNFFYAFENQCGILDQFKTISTLDLIEVGTKNNDYIYFSTPFLVKESSKIIIKDSIFFNHVSGESGGVNYIFILKKKFQGFFV